MTVAPENNPTYNVPLTVYFRETDVDTIEQVMQKFPNRWSSKAHYLRCANMSFQRELNKDMNLKTEWRVRQ